jgi:hypothetical protein
MCIQKQQHSVKAIFREGLDTAERASSTMRLKRTTSPPQQQQQRKHQDQRHVSFHNENQELSLLPLTDGEREIRWYTRNELARLRSCSNRFADDDDLPVSDDEPSQSSSSIEPQPHVEASADFRFHVSGSSSSADKRREFIETLLAQQWEHKQMGISDPKGLYQLSKACTKQSRLLAIRQAKEAAQQVKQEQENYRSGVKYLARQLDCVLDLVGDGTDHF